MKRVRALLGSIVVAIAAASGCGSDDTSRQPSQDGQGEELSFAFDSSVQPQAGHVPGIDGQAERPVASIVDSNGNQADFVANELIVSTDERSELDALVQRWDGELLATVDPGDLGVAEGPVHYLVRVDTSRASTTELQEQLAALEAEPRGPVRVSSERALGLLAIAAVESVQHRANVAANWILRGDTIARRSTAEAPTTAGPSASYTPDAFDWPYMKLGGAQDIGVAEAWRILDASGRTSNKVKIGIADGGFNPNADFPSSVSIFPSGAFGIRNPDTCTDGTACPWHGTDVTTAAMGLPDNAFGGAGPAGPVAEGVFLQSPSPDFFSYVRQVGATVRALSTKPRIINISASARVPAAACLFACGALDALTNLLRAADMLLFASAGNDGIDVDAEDCFIGCWEEAAIIPCELSGVVCVGGLAHDSDRRDPSSNFGSRPRDSGTVDIYAPFSVWSGPDPDLDAGSNVSRFVSGTSFSSPFTAGVAALIMAANPGLDGRQVEGILLSTAHTGSADRRVHRWVNAHDAVLEALGGDAPPFLLIRNPMDGAALALGQNVLLEAEVSDDGGPPSVRWSSSLEGDLGEGARFGSRRLSVGRHVITATADDGTWRVADSVTVEVSNGAPTMFIDTPLEGDRFFASQNIYLAGRSFDPNEEGYTLPDSWVRWMVDGSALSTGHTAEIPGGTLPVGLHTVRFAGSDGSAEAAKTIQIEILPDPVDLPPDVRITNPSGTLRVMADREDAVGWYYELTLRGRASDPEDGPLPGAALVWTDSVDGATPTVLGAFAERSVRLYAHGCGSEHRITLTARDSAGNEVHHSVLVRVELLC